MVLLHIIFYTHCNCILIKPNMGCYRLLIFNTR
nr:MAG TPA: hypothetical protein [Caudoviricetes sp.]